MQFHEKLQKLRKDACMTQMELAEKLMVSRQAISKWETGNAIPDIENMVSICDLFHVSLDDLVRDTQTVKEEEKVSDDTDKKVWQENKKVTPKRRIIMVILLIAAVLLAGCPLSQFINGSPDTVTC